MRAGKENQGRKRLITISDERRVKKRISNYVWFKTACNVEHRRRVKQTTVKHGRNHANRANTHQLGENAVRVLNHTKKGRSETE